MNAFKVTFEDGNSLVTNMNATLDEAKQYYIGTPFNFGDTDECPHDKMVKAVKVEALKPDGFMFEGKKIFYIDAKGKDISFNRWRMDLYYSTYLATTAFMPSQEAYDKFIATNRPDCYVDFEQFKKDHEDVLPWHEINEKINAYNQR